MKQALLVFYTYGTFKRISDIKEEEIKKPAYDVNVLTFVKFLPKEDFPFSLHTFYFSFQKAKE